jgi:hypothetical protein
LAIARAVQRRRRRLKAAPQQWRPAGQFLVIKIVPDEDRALIDQWLGKHR